MSPFRSAQFAVSVVAPGSPSVDTEGVGRRRALFFSLGAFALAIVALACGPSFQVVYEGDVRFEHCYGMDQTAAPIETKKECWRQWLKGYTYGQSRDRVEFAASRVNALSVSTPPDDPPGHIAAAPMPTNAFAPPPNIAASADGVGSAAAPSAPVSISSARPRTPGSDCADACEARWTSCRNGCRDATCANCDRAYRGCMPPCFKDEPMSRQPVRSLR